MTIRETAEPFCALLKAGQHEEAAGAVASLRSGYALPA
jgi:hypothetical protein